MDQVIGAVGVLTVDSFPITTFRSRPKDQPAGRYRVEFEFRHPLTATNIQFVVGISSYDRTFYYKQTSGYVSISQIAIDEQPIRASGAGLLLSVQRCEIMPIG
jgi:hypothetical protein